VARRDCVCTGQVRIRPRDFQDAVIPSPASLTVGERLLHKRLERGWSIQEAASQLGIDRTTWQDREHGELIQWECREP